MPPQYPICSFNNTLCRFCSNESTYCACTFIQKRDSHYIGVKVGYIKSERGQYCNNICDWIKNLKSCPKDDDTMKGEVLEEWEKKYMKKAFVKKAGKKPTMVKKEKPIKKVVTATVEKLVKKPVKKSVKKPIKKSVKKVTSQNKKKAVVKKPTTKKKPAVKKTPVVKKQKRKYTKKVVEKPKRKYVKNTPIVEEKPKRKYVKKISTTHKKKPVVKKVTPKQKKEIIYI